MAIETFISPLLLSGKAIYRKSSETQIGTICDMIAFAHCGKFPTSGKHIAKSLVILWNHESEMKDGFVTFENRKKN